MEVNKQGSVLRVRQNKDNATKIPAPQHGHHGQHVAQHVHQVYKPEAVEEELRRGTVPQSSVPVEVSIYSIGQN